MLQCLHQCSAPSNVETEHTHTGRERQEEVGGEEGKWGERRKGKDEGGGRERGGRGKREEVEEREREEINKIVFQYTEMTAILHSAMLPLHTNMQLQVQVNNIVI